MQSRWTAYNHLHKEDSKYVHATVNHSVNFVAPGSGGKVCTNRIEGAWRQVGKLKYHALKCAEMH